jgi:hypothetical protein
MLLGRNLVPPVDRREMKERALGGPHASSKVDVPDLPAGSADQDQLLESLDARVVVVGPQNVRLEFGAGAARPAQLTPMSGLLGHESLYPLPLGGVELRLQANART